MYGHVYKYVETACVSTCGYVHVYRHVHYIHIYKRLLHYTLVYTHLLVFNLLYLWVSRELGEFWAGL